MFLVFAVAFAGISWKVFQWRNPLANEMVFFREFGSVVTFKRVPAYQTK